MDSSPPSNDDIEAVIQMATATTDGRPAKDTRTQLFVGNLPYRVRWQDLKDLFRKAGTVLRADVSLGPDNRSRGYGTVLLATAEDAGRAIDMFNGYSWQSRILEVRPDRLPPEYDHPALLSEMTLGVRGPSRVGLTPELDASLLVPATPSRNLFVGNLPFHCQWQDLKDLFRQAGTIVRADVALGPDGRSRGFGTVSFATEYDAERALKMFNGYDYNGRLLKVHYDRFTPTIPGTTPASPVMSSYSSIRSPSPFQSSSSSRPNHVVMPPGYTLDYGPVSAPTTPYDLYPSALHRPPVSSLLNPLSQQSFRSSQDVDPLADLLSSVHIPSHRTSSNSSSDSKPSLSTRTTSSSCNTTPPSDTSPPPQHSSEAPVPPKLQHQSSSGNNHPHHPGPISIPPLQGPFSLPMHNISPGMAMPMISPIYHPVNMSPLHHPAAQAGLMTPQGIPITPSMPPFTFSAHLPIPSPTTAMFPSSLALQTPPISASSSGVTTEPSSASAAAAAAAAAQTAIAAAQATGAVTPFSPGVALSPGMVWGRPGGPNPFINPAVGAPVHMVPFYYAQQPQQQQQQSQSQPSEPGGYFDQLFMMPPPTSSALTASPEYEPATSSVEKEILRRKSEETQYQTGEDNKRTESIDNKTPPTSSPSRTKFMTRADSDPVPSSSTNGEEGDKHVISR